MVSSCITFTPCSPSNKIIGIKRGDKITTFTFLVTPSPVPNDQVRMVHCIAGMTYRGRSWWKKQNLQVGQRYKQKRYIPEISVSDDVKESNEKIMENRKKQAEKDADAMAKASAEAAEAAEAEEGEGGDTATDGESDGGGEGENAAPAADDAETVEDSTPAESEPSAPEEPAEEPKKKKKKKK